ncbi:hypothetical protein [Streptomyces mirabilis]|uniref:hypothetical protein n=1 Tax=Streptomyces mirabilis TaxID=68239 RepID=UPI0021C03412|nr:hypothetical protein [Streptomyces mirabilis]MCT9107590.1 hypothetical protein [Streptomyces mirabilis]
MNEVDVPLDAEVLEERRAAGRELVVAFRNSGVSVLDNVGTASGSPAVTLTLPDHNSHPRKYAGGATLVPHTAQSLRQLMTESGIDALVDVVEWGPGAALKVTLASPRDAQLLSQLVMDNLSAEHRAALQLRTTFQAAGISKNEVRADTGVVRLGDVSAEDAVVLYRALGGEDDLVKDLDLDNWRSLDVLSDLVHKTASAAAGADVAAEPKPACSTCRAARPHRITLGSLPCDHARRLTVTLATFVQARTCPAPPAS